MKVLCFLLVLTYFLSENAADNSKAEAENNFKVYFKKAFKLVSNNSNNASEQSSIRSRKSIKIYLDSDKLLDEAWKRYQQREKLGELQKVSKATPDEKIEFIANEIWERTGEQWVEKSLTIIGAKAGSQIGGAVGGFIGMTIGGLVPPFSLPLTIGGVFIGQNFGKMIGAWGGKISAYYVNDLIASKIVKPIVGRKMKGIFRDFLKETSKSKNVTCRSDICSSGRAEQNCICVKCNSKMTLFLKMNGAASCQTCFLGTIPTNYKYGVGYTRCSKCNKGNYGKSDGNCYFCSGDMQYSDIEGSTSCKTCPLGSVPGGSSYRVHGNTKCYSCDKGNYGKSDGKCHFCSGDMQYSDIEGSTSCKTCPLGSVPGGSSYREHGNTKCYSCYKGNYGKSDGKCHFCSGDMEYNDVEGASSCKTCPLGSIPKGSSYGTNGNTWCAKCSKGNYGKSDGRCHFCLDDLDYSDVEGAISCKKCPLGSVPGGSSYREHGNTKCYGCNKGNYGKSDGKCHFCSGDMEYNDVESASSCKTCPLGSIPKGSSYRTNGNTWCAKCSKGNYGKFDGRCHFCLDDLDYSDVEGATSCKKCPLGSVPGGSSYREHGNTKCYRCNKGNYGKSDGKCYFCSGDMEYSDIEGSSSCKKCPLGSVPEGSSYRENGNTRCTKCSKGNYGKNDGKCHFCSGDMEYSDIEGATSCKKCPLGSSTEGRSYGEHGWTRCVKCRAGTYGKSDGYCYKCNGDMSYSPTEGATACSTCPSGTSPADGHTRCE